MTARVTATVVRRTAAHGRPTDAERLTRAIAVSGAALGGGALVVTLTVTGSLDAGTFAFVVPVGGLIAVGTLIVVRRRTNVVGWLCWLAGQVATLAIASGTYTEYALARGGLPGVAVAGWLDLWLGSAWVSMLLWIPLVFPDGRLPSIRWRPVAMLAVSSVIGLTAVRALNPTVYAGAPLGYNPLGVEGAEQLFATLERVAWAGIALPLVMGAAALAVRVRRNDGAERLQVMWLLYASALVVGLFVHFALAPTALSEPASDVAFGLGYGTVPIAIGVAVLRYRLYEIDHIIRRTIVYAVLTAVLGLVYAGGVLVAGSAVGGERSDLAVAASTLAAAALFRPLRDRIQRAVDRRFNRRRFDAARTVLAFIGTVRRELDADALVGELLAVTRRVVEPTHVSLWRPTGSRRVGRAG